MQQNKNWLYDCNKCGFSASTLRAGSGRGVGGLEKLRRSNFRRILNKLKKTEKLNNKKLLEVGCAEGWFLEEARKLGVKGYSIEASREHALIAEEKGFIVQNGFFPQDLKTDTKFDYIIFNDVFEHIKDPGDAVQKCYEILKADGTLIINLPSKTGIFYRLASILLRMGRPKLMERLWQKDFASPHLTYFNARTLAKLIAKKSEFRLVEFYNLETISKDGLLERINASHRGWVGNSICLILLFLVPVIKYMPSDAIVGVFKK